MTTSLALTEFSNRLVEYIHQSATVPPGTESGFEELALELFQLQFEAVAPYRRLCEVRGLHPQTLRSWKDIPALPNRAFREFAVSSLTEVERTQVFLSSGTTSQDSRSRHFHSAESLRMYEESIVPWFEHNVLRRAKGSRGQFRPAVRMLALTPPATMAPNSSLVHMFQTVRNAFSFTTADFVGRLSPAGTWQLDFVATLRALENSVAKAEPVLVLGPAYAFVHLVDHLAESGRQLRLPAGSRVMETGGYKGQSRIVTKGELHALICKYLGVQPDNIIIEYGMAELSSQAYAAPNHEFAATPDEAVFQFPPWARVLIASPEDNLEVPRGEIGIIRVLDLANVWSVMAVQTEDLGRAHEMGFELIGRQAHAEPRGCSLMLAAS